MKIGYLIFSFIVYWSWALPVYAQEDTQEQLFQKYQTMIFIEELNQHCPMLSRLEAEVLNGQIIFADSNFSGSLDQVNDYKLGARLYARSVPCHAPDIKALLDMARQEAGDAMVNHILLVRQIHLLDLADVEGKKIPGGLLLSELSYENWSVINGFYQEVKDNYLTRVGQDSWDKFEQSIIKVAEKRTAATFMSNEVIIKSNASGSFAAVQAITNNKDISSYYFYLKKSADAFLAGSQVEKSGYPFSRPANDFTNWTAYRPRNGDLNWLLSYDGCGGRWQGFECSLFISTKDEVGLVLSGEKATDIKEVNITFRNPDDEKTYRKLIILEAPMGSNEADFKDLKKNAELINSASNALKFKVFPSDKHQQISAQTGDELPKDNKIFILPPELLTMLGKLQENDVLKIKLGQEKDGIIPLNNFHRALNWATVDIYYQ